MKQQMFYVLAFLAALFVYSCANPNPNSSSGSDSSSRKASECDVDLEKVFLVVDTTYALEGEDKVGINLFWTPIKDAVSYSITTNTAKEATLINAPDTTISIKTELKMDAGFSASLSATLANGAVCGPVTLAANYCNGGGTVDDIFQTVSWPELCNESSCDFVRFMRKNIKDCNGNFIDPIPWNLRNGLYYKRQDVCNCLTNTGAIPICDGVQGANLNNCLSSLTKCLKHNYQPCN